MLSQSAESLQELFHKGTEGCVQKHAPFLMELLIKSSQRPLALSVDPLFCLLLVVTALKSPAHLLMLPRNEAANQISST